MSLKVASAFTSSLLAAMLIGVVALAVPLIAKAQGEGATAGEEVRETYEAMKDYTFTRREEASAWLNRRLRELDAQIAALSAEAGARGQALIDDLRKQRAAAAGQLERLQDASSDAWESVKQASIAAFGKLEQTVEQAQSRFEQLPGSDAIKPPRPARASDDPPTPPAPPVAPPVPRPS